MPEYFSIGEVRPDLQAENLTSAEAKAMLAICLASREFEVLELRNWERADVGKCDVIVLDCFNDQVPTRNALKIKVTERLALVFPHNSTFPPEVRAIRKDFPVVPHLNHPAPGDPSWLCLYLEPWPIVQRTWTPHKHLQQILAWLSETAKGSLHRTDQPVERIYFDSSLDLVLPTDFSSNLRHQELALLLGVIDRQDGHRTIRAEFGPLIELEKHGVPSIVPLVLTLDSVVHGRVEQYPHDLGTLHDQLFSHQAPFLPRLQHVIRQSAEGRGLTRSDKQSCLLILHLSVKRTAVALPETTETRGFLVPCSLAMLGLATGVLSEHNEYYFAVPLVGDSKPPEPTDWRSIQVVPLDVKPALTREFARQSSGINDATANDRRILAGLGALGGSLADLWSREAWGEWTFVDSDYIQPHNLVRHIAKDIHIGSFKVQVTKQITDFNYNQGYASSKAIPGSILDQTNPDIQESLSRASLLVDATTTLEVPRDLSQRGAICRSVSVFLTPSGVASVLLLEDAKREIRLDCLEAQYYFAILNNDWGKHHLAGHKGHLWVGAGCRDKSAIMSNESVQLHSAILARQIRLLSHCEEACIRVWTAEETTGAVSATQVPVQSITVIDVDGWRIVVHGGVKSKLNALRHHHLPCETGGVIVGYADHMLRAMFVVDVLPAPPDSVGDQTGFTRGTEGLEPQLSEVKRRTANVVGYIGEWHSHPPFNSASPSRDDRILMDHLTDMLARDGEPSIMIIVGSANTLSISFRS